MGERLICFHSYSLEEVDNRVVVHIKNMIEHHQRTSITVRTVDSDVVVILAAFMTQFLEYSAQIKLWVDFGTGIHRRLIFINMTFNMIIWESPFH